MIFTCCKVSRQAALFPCQPTSQPVSSHSLQELNHISLAQEQLTGALSFKGELNHTVGARGGGVLLCLTLHWTYREVLLSVHPPVHPLAPPTYPHPLPLTSTSTTLLWKIPDILHVLQVSNSLHQLGSPVCICCQGGRSHLQREPIKFKSIAKGIWKCESKKQLVYIGGGVPECTSNKVYEY